MTELTSESIRAIIRETLAERDAQAAIERQEQAEREAAELASIRRSQLTPRQTARLVERLGYEGYMKLRWGDDDQPRDPVTGRFKTHR
jgi:hypothetical protein